MVVAFTMAFLALATYALLSPTVTESANAETNISVGTGGYTLSVSSSTSGSVDMSINPTSGGSFTMVKETLNTKTNADGFSMYIGMSDNTNNLYLNGDTSSTALPATNASTASYTEPNTISTNSWGYAIPQSSTMPIDGGTLTNNNLASNNGFNTGSYIDNSDSESDTKWAPVPVKGHEQIIQSTDTANNTTGVDLNIFYGTKINSSQAAGIYKGTVVYTAVTKSNSALIASSSPSTTMNLGGGDTITITIGTNTDYSNLATKTVTITNDPANATSLDQCTITGGGNNLDGTLYLTCALPAKELSGKYDINIDLGTYGTYTIAGGIEYIYKEPPEFFKIATMQEMTAYVCSSVDTPGSNITALTADNGSDYISGGTIVPSHTLIDDRDGQAYTVRKLADGNCWMTDNLRLGKNGSVALNDQNSNMTTGRTFTLPAAYTVSDYNAKVAQDGKGWTWANQATYPFVFYRDSNPGAVSATIKPDGVTPDSPSALYNWYTATAGARDSSGNSVMTNTNTPVDSVCPKGWQLPVTSSSYNINLNKSYMKLVNIYTGATENSWVTTSSDPDRAALNTTRIIKLLSEPTSFVYSDYYSYGGTLYSRPVGSYWSSSLQSATDAYRLYIRTYDTYRYLEPRSNSSKGYAFAVRCVAQ